MRAPLGAVDPRKVVLGHRRKAVILPKEVEVWRVEKAEDMKRMSLLSVQYLVKLHPLWNRRMSVKVKAPHRTIHSRN